MGSCENYDPFLGTLNIWCRIIIGIQKGTIILTTTHTLALAYSNWRFVGNTEYNPYYRPLKYGP